MHLPLSVLRYRSSYLFFIGIGPVAECQVGMAESAVQEPMLTGALTVPRRYRGIPVPSWFNEATSQKLETESLRPADVLLCSWPKSGTHWVHRALRLLSSSGDDASSSMLLAEMLPPGPHDGVDPRPWNPDGKDHFEALLEREGAAEPRLIVTHAPAEWLPLARAAAAGNGKLVYVTRDPRDVITSNYFFMGEPKDGWAGSMERFLAPATRTPNAFGGWPEHVAGFEALVAALGPERAVLVEYEEMHADLPGQLRRLAALLGPAAEARLETHGDEICEALGFSAMQGGGGSDARFLRKGKAGGWREHFSDADAARVAAMVDERLPAATSAVGCSTWRAR